MFSKFLDQQNGISKTAPLASINWLATLFQTMFTRRTAVFRAALKKIVVYSISILGVLLSTGNLASQADPLQSNNLLNNPNFPQESVASSDDITGLYFNPAGLGYHPLQVGYYLGRNPEDKLTDHTVFLNLLGFAFSSQFRLTDGDDYANRYTIGTSFLNSRWFSAGVTYSWLNSSDPQLNAYNQWDLGFMLRPFRWLSLGAVARGINLPTYQGKKLENRWDLGFSLRPLPWAPESLTFSVDTRWDPNQPVDRWIPRYMIEAVPLAGTTLFGGWDNYTNIFFGLKQSLEITQVSMQMTSPQSGSSFFAGGFLFGRERFSRGYTPLRQYLEISLDIPFDEQKKNGFLFTSDNFTFLELLQTIDTARKDQKIIGIILTGREFKGGWGQAEELRKALANFAAKKPVYAWLENAANKEYYIASIAESIEMPPGATLELNGLKAESIFIKDLFQKIGIQADFVAIGDYKSAPDMFLRDSPSEFDQRQIKAILASISNHMKSTIIKDRNLAESEIEALLNHGLYTANSAKEKKLIDRVSYYSDFKEALISDQVLPAIWNTDVISYSSSNFYDDTWSDKPVVAVVVLDGEIVSGTSSNGGIFTSTKIGSDTIVPVLQSLRSNASVKSVVIRINSPGGSSLASDLIWREIRNLQEEKKNVIVSIGDVAASGGYYLAVGSDQIIANETSVTGSIGIFTGKFSLKGLYEWLGVNKYVYKTNDKSAIFSETDVFSNEERTLLREQLGEFYELFLERVGRSRKIGREAIIQEAGGKVYTGKYAESKGMVDKNGGLALAIELAMAKAEISEDYAQILVYPEGETSLLGLGDTDRLMLPALVKTAIRLVARSEQIRDDKVLMLMPYELDIR